MADGGAFSSGFGMGFQRTSHRRAVKEQHKEAEWLDKHNDLVNEREAIRQRIYNLDPNSPTYADDYAKGHQALTKTIQDYQDFLHPDKNPGAFEAVKHLIGLNSHPLTQIAPPRIGSSKAEPGVEGGTVDLGSGPVTMPATPEYKGSPAVAPAPQPGQYSTGTVKQLKERAKKLKEANDEVERMLAGAPMSLEQQAVESANAQGAGTEAGIKSAMITLDRLKPSATPEERQSYLNDLLRTTSGEKPGAENFKTQNVILSDGTVISAQQDTKSGKWFDLNKNPIPPELLAGSKLEPKPIPKKGLKYEAATGEVVDQDANKRYSIADVGKPETPPEVAQMFTDSKAMMDTKQRNALALATQRGAAYGQQRYGDYRDPSNPTEVISVPNIQAQKEGLHRAAGPAYQAETGMLKASTYGSIGNEIVAFSTAIQHADLLEQAALALNNNDTQKLNAIKNELSTQFGDPEPTNFKVIANAYTREVTKALTAGHVTDNEIRENGATIPQDASQAQIIGAINAYRKLMNSKILIRRQQIESGMAGTPFLGAGANLDPNAQPHAGGAPAAHTYKSYAKGPNNHRIGTNDDPHSADAKWFDVQTGKPVQ